MTRQVHVSSLSAWVLPYPPGYDFPLPYRLVAFASWTLILPLGFWAFVAIGLLAHSTVGPDPIGVVMFHIVEMQSGWVPSVLRGLVPSRRITVLMRLLTAESWVQRSLPIFTVFISHPPVIRRSRSFM